MQTRLPISSTIAHTRRAICLTSFVGITLALGTLPNHTPAEEFPQGFAPPAANSDSAAAQGAESNAVDDKSADVNSPTPAIAATPEQVAQWVAELDHDDFKVRQLAATRLTAAGKTAIPALVPAVQAGKLEVMAQGLGILRKFFEGNDAELKTAATTALGEIAKGTDATAAQRAKDIINPAPPVALNTTSAADDPFGTPNPNQIAPGGGIILRNGNLIPQPRFRPNLNGARIAIQAQAIANNGQHKVRVNENGRQVEIDQDPQEIRVALIEDGKTSEYKAKNLDELKKNHPEGFKLYEKYGQGAVGGAIAAGNAPFGNVPFGNVPPGNVPPGFPAPAANALEIRLRMAEQMLKHAETVVQQTANDAQHKDALKETLAKIQAAQAELKAATEKLRQPEEEKP
ncbi:MAG: hypothetical protein SFX18_08395 [Pirellulales bacterium]|nr:hypothetical protein [Pirellulales bacterium]